MIRKSVVAVAALAIIVGCDNGPTVDLTAQAGNYVLRTVNGSALPVTVEVIGLTQRDLIADTLFLGVNGSFTDNVYLRDTEGATVRNFTQVDVGTWTANGSSLTFKSADGTVIAGVVQGNTLSIGETNAVYSK
ncbi:MAG: hypothetical protein V4550_13835 [Gemmatimonadota bacterium]